VPDALIHTQGLRPARAPKIVRECSLPLTALRRVDLVVTELAVIEPTDDGLVLKELAPGVGRHRVVAATGAKLRVPAFVPEMPIRADRDRPPLEQAPPTAA
jgi:acetate CoA/acetoacetate CoA-transferase beta subunit